MFSYVRLRSERRMPSDVDESCVGLLKEGKDRKNLSTNRWRTGAKEWEKVKRRETKPD